MGNLGKILGAIVAAGAVATTAAVAGAKTIKKKMEGKNENQSNEGKRFCSQCGKELDEDSKFCSGCGKSTEQVLLQPTAPVATENNTVHKQEYVGTVCKCPNCGDILDAYELKCEVCGWEVRKGKSKSSLQEFVLKLQEIESKGINDNKQNESALKKLIGIDLNLGATRKLEKQKIQEKANLISTFIVSNTKEDILEFLQLSLSNIARLRSSVPDNDEVLNAWIAKFKQCDQKAKMMLASDREYLKIQVEYYKIYKKLGVKAEKTL